MKSTLIKIVLSFILLLIKWMPKAFVPWIAEAASALAPHLMKRDCQLIASNIHRVYKLPPHSNFSKTFQRQVIRSQILIAFETMKSQLAAKALLHIEGLEALQPEVLRLMKDGKGLIVVTAHIGSWELNAPAVAEVSGQSFYALAKPSKLPEFTTILEDLRRRGQTEVLWTDNRSILKDMMAVLKKGAPLGFVMDQKPEGRIGPLVDFLGQKTEFVSGPAKLAIRFRSPILAIFAIRTAPWTYRIVFETLAEAGHEWADESALTQHMAAAIDRTIQSYPEQWVWNYKRWRTPT